MSSDSRYLSLLLRHRPDLIGIDLEGAGWADVAGLLRAMKRYGRPMSRSRLEAIVATDEKRRFTLSSDRSRIRAAQGHSIALDLGLVPVIPPPMLYHGTARHQLDSIFAEGLRAQRRQFVHLSAKTADARAIGQRHGKPVVLTIDCGSMSDEGHVFFQADNGIWMTTAVPPRFLGFAQL